jgi:5-methylcytosine-specific restriction endonuclease McrA
MTQRNGGELRGNSADRRARKLFLLNKKGDGVQAPCHECSNVVTYETMIVDRIIPGIQGGRYTRDNIQIHCHTCSDLQGYALGFGAKHLVTA